MNPPSEQAREAQRQAHRVRLVDRREEGTAAEHLPPGVYGFTGAPALASPLFAERRYRNFEIHHLPDHTIVIVGFVTPEVARKLRETPDQLHITILPDAENDSTEIVAVPYARIAHHRQYSMRNAPGLEIDVRPLHEAVR